MTDLEEKYPGAQRFKFGDNPRLCDDLLALVIAGKKTATCGAARDYVDCPEELPVIGRRDIATRWDGTPAVVIETVDVFRSTFNDIPDDFRLAEGENDTPEGWARDHRAYFERNGGWSPDMELVAEVFRVVEVL